MIAFIIIAVLALLIAVVILATPLLLRRIDAMGREQADAQVFRDQLAEVDRDLSRGAISAEEAEGARIEVSRRLLRADRESKSMLSAGPKGVSRMAALVVLVAVPAISLGFYANLGQPGLPGQPLADRIAAQADRPSQAEAEEIANLDPMPPIQDEELARHLEQLEKVVATRPDDPEGQRLMGITQLRAGRYVAARKAFDRYLELTDDVSPDTHANHAEALILGAGGYVSPDAEQALGRALRVDPENRMARYYAGIALMQAGRFAPAVQIWQRLRTEVPDGSPVAATLDALLADASRRMPNAIPGPSQEDIEAAQQMTPEQRAEMIAGMIARLEERLTTQGGEVEEWLRLMTAYNQMGQKDEAQRVYQLGLEAQTDATARSFLKEQALLMGLEAQ